MMGGPTCTGPVCIFPAGIPTWEILSITVVDGIFIVIFSSAGEPNLAGLGEFVVSVFVLVFFYTDNQMYLRLHCPVLILNVLNFVNFRNNLLDNLLHIHWQILGWRNHFFPLKRCWSYRPITDTKCIHFFHGHLFPFDLNRSHHILSLRREDFCRGWQVSMELNMVGLSWSYSCSLL